MQTTYNPQWINRGNGHYEFTGDELYNIPNDLIGTIKFLSAPNARDVILSSCDNLESFEAPNAQRVDLFSCDNLESFEAENAQRVDLSICDNLKRFAAENAKIVHLSYCGNLERLEAPKAEIVHLSGCDNLESFEASNATEVHLSICGNLERLEAPNATEVYLSDCGNLERFEAPNAHIVRLSSCDKLKRFEAPEATRIALQSYNQHLQNITIQQLKNPQKLETFMINDQQDIAPDIKNADRDLNGSNDAIRTKELITRKCLDTTISRLKGDGKYDAMSVIGGFLNQNEIHKLQFLNKKAYDNMKSQPHLSDFANLSKTNIAERTHAHTDMSNAKTTGRVRSDVPVSYGI